MFKTAILFNVFNRPEKTQQVFDAIKAKKPKYLFVHCDGPRDNNLSDIEKVKKVQNIILNGVDWECELKTTFRETNYGCGKGPASAMTWFFENVEQGIILEDDCLPHIDFFDYCEILLNKYKLDETIGVIGGTNFDSKNSSKEFSYEFTKYAGIWGWATWKRTWEKFEFDFNMNEIDFSKKVSSFLNNIHALNYWLNILTEVNNNKAKTYWDYQLHLIMMTYNLIHIKPNKNLIKNIGFDNEANHTFDTNSNLSNITTKSILPLLHPNIIKVVCNDGKGLYKNKNGFFLKFKKQLKSLLKLIK